MLSITDQTNLKGKRVFVRADFNVPFKNGVIENDFRIRKAIPTLKFLLDAGARVIIGAHLWGDDAARGNGMSMHETIYRPLKKLLKGYTLTAAKSLKDSKEFAQKIGDGEALLLENLRYDPGEMKNDPAFAQELADLADIYVNEAFSTSHREHASIVGIPKLIPGYAGIQFMKEFENLSLAFDPPHPFVFIIGGAKFETKLPLIEKFLHRADRVYVTGALANAFFQAQGFDVGISLVPKKPIDLFGMLDNPNLVLPTDVVVKNGEEIHHKTLAEVGEGDNILDVGTESMAELESLVSDAAYVLWNGPVGDYEVGFGDTTYELARIIAGLTDTTTIVGGGDTIAAITKLDKEDAFTFLSTAGGAMLDFLAAETLPGIEALNESSSAKSAA